MVELPLAVDGLSSQAAAGILRSLGTGQFCDFEFVCGELRVPVHRAVVCSQSPVFAAACLGRKPQAANSNSLQIPDTDPQTVRLMVQYLYTGKHAFSLQVLGSLHDTSIATCETRVIDDPGYTRMKNAYVTVLTAHIKLVALSETYHIHQLVEQVVREFRALISRPECGYCFVAIIEVIPRVYELENASGNILRRECIAAIVASFGPWLTAHGYHRKALDNVLAAVPQFQKELLEGFIVGKHQIGQKKDSVPESESRDQ
ncbi:BTB POZ fold domain containing [Cordyceps militaris]|uniref:BTB POZ fold domain containing n=1 Tax=Cordyceps militaris TaxID=73501 RepID=A0A2H4SLP5_CORMI|nr:BTB POZ fold domain containing [Cordyceps militaris]